MPPPLFRVSRPQEVPPMGDLSAPAMPLPLVPTSPGLQALGAPPQMSQQLDQSEFPSFLRTDLPPAEAAALPQVQAPAVAPLPQVPFLRAMATGRPVGDVTSEMLPQQPQATSPPRPRLLGRAAPPAPAAPEVNSLGQTLAPDFIDGMTQSRAPMWVEPRETPYDRERRALEAARGIEQQRAEMMAGQAMDRADAEDAYLRRQNALEVQRREDEGRARQSMQRAADRLAATQMEPGRYWRNAGAFGVIGNALAVGLGALGESMGGGPNTALQTINEAIDRDLSAQERDITTATQDVENRRGLLREVQNEFVSRQGALEASRAILLRQAAAQAEAQAAQLGSQEIAANAARARDQLLTQAERAQAAAQAAEIEAALSMREQVARIRGLEARALRDERRASWTGTGAASVAAMNPNELRTRLANADTIVRSGGTVEQAEQQAGLPPGTMTTRTVSSEESGRLGAYENAIRALEEVLPSDFGQEGGSDVEGVGVLPSIGASIPGLRQILSSPRGRLIRTRAEAAARRFLRVESGGAITPTEEDSEIEAMGLGVGATEEAFIEGVQRLRRDHRSRVRPSGNTQATQDIGRAALAATGARRVIEE